MPIGWMRCLLICCIALSTSAVRAEEPVNAFLSGLLRHGYADTALIYLERLDPQLELSPQVREILPYHHAVILMHCAEQTLRPQEKREFEEKSAALFSQFIKNHPEHALVPQAQMSLVELQLQQAKSHLEASEGHDSSPARQDNWPDIRQQIAEIQTVFLQQRDRYQTYSDQYPAFIPADEPELRRARDHVQEMLIRSCLDLAQCKYWEAQTYPVDSPQRQQLLKSAGNSYELIHQRYRSQVGGLFARLWQGKCYEGLRDEQGMRLALGIYGEILEHDGTSSALVLLKDQALLYRLVCLNSEFRKDFQLVEMESESWLENAGRRSNSETGLAIQWELCRALDALAQDAQWPPDTRHDFLVRAHEHILRLQALTGGQTREFNEFRLKIESRL